MEILESVDPEEVPEGLTRTARPGLWTGLARRAIADCEEGKVTVVVLKDEDEYVRMRGGVSETINKAGYSRRFRVQTQSDGRVKVYMGLEAKEEPRNSHPRRPAASGIRPVRN